MENLALLHTISYGFLTPCQNLEKVMIQFQENAWTEGQKDGRKDGKTLFHRALQATAEGPKIQDYRIKSTYLFQFKSKI